MTERGVYHYWLNGTDTGIREAWHMHTQPTGEQIIEITRDASVYGSQISVTIVRQAALLRSATIEWRNNTPGHVAHAHALYTLNDGRLHVSRTADGQSSQASIELGSGRIFSPLVRVTFGSVLRALLGSPHGAEVIVPDIRDPADALRLLAPHIEQRHAQLVGDDTILLYGTPTHALKVDYATAASDDCFTYWLNDRDLVLRYQMQRGAQLWDVFLA
jgi:hypothetical protein